MRVRLSLVCLGILTAILTGASAAPLWAESDSFVNAHCVACHGPNEPKAGLNLETLASDWTDAPAMAHWVRIFDRVTKGEMPPRDVDRPTDAERAGFLKSLGEKLHAASLAKQQREGRGLVAGSSDRNSFLPAQSVPATPHFR